MCIGALGGVGDKWERLLAPTLDHATYPVQPLKWGLAGNIEEVLQA